MFNTIHTTRQSLSLLAPFKILLLSLKVSDLIYDINSSTSHNMCSEENIYPSTVYQMVRESLYTCIDDVFTVYVYILSLNLLSFRTSFWSHLFKEDCFFIYLQIPENFCRKTTSMPSYVELAVVACKRLNLWFTRCVFSCLGSQV